MYIVIFTATTNQLDNQYSEMAKQLRDLAFKEFACLDFHSVMENNQEITKK